ncbi:MAG: RNA 2',3'-cyclic phosphodiesterase [Alphaproteobacteria bacterium]
MIRLFVAIPLPGPVRQHLSLLSGGIPGAAWAAAETLHLTLRFIGEVEEGVAEDIDDALSRIRQAPFDLALAELGLFSTGRNPRTLWAGVERSEPLARLQAKVETAVIDAGLVPESRKFTPHVTLARLKNAPWGRVEQVLAGHAGFRAGPFTVDRFTLYSSLLAREGAIHTPEADYPLDG